MPSTLRSIADLPGPPPLPLIGNLHQVDTARIHRSLEAWSERYGAFFRFRLGRRQIVCVADPAAIGAMLRDRPNGFRRTKLLEAVFRELGIAGVFAANGDAWRAQRKMVMAAFGTSHLKRYFPFLARVTERFHRRWSDHASRGTEFDLQADLMRFTVDVVAGLAFGVDINSIESAEVTLQTHLNHIFPMLNRRLTAPMPYWRWIKFPADRALERHLDVVRRSVAEFITAARGRIESRPALREAPENLIEAMLAASESGGCLTEADVASNVVTMLLAGEDTTANTLAWLFYLVSLHPPVMQNLALEAAAVLGAGHFPERFEQASALAVTAATAHETMRLKPVAPILLVQAVEARTIGDIAIPADTVVAALLRRGSMDQRHFANPQAFEPQRWLAAPGSAASTAAARISMPFGAGPRICPGRNLALIEICMVTSMLFRNFEIRSLRTEHGGPPEERLAFTMSPSRLWVRLVHRPDAGIVAA
jgi:cytochrome P450